MKQRLILLTVLLSVLYFAMFSASQNTSKNGVEWSEDLLLTNVMDDAKCLWPDIAVDASNIYVVYHKEYPDPFAEERYIMFRQSFDNGITWCPEIKLARSVATYIPKIALNGSNIHVVYNLHSSDNIYYKHSLDGGLTWSDDVALTESDGEFSWLPDIGVSGNYVHVVWSDSKDTGSVGAKEIYYRRSIDYGKNWSEEKRLTNNSYDSATPLIVAQGSMVYIIFADNQDGNYEAFYIRSDDNGENWTEPKRIIPADGIKSGPFSLVVNNINLYLVGRDERWAGGNSYYSIWFTSSIDNGDNWSEPIYVVPEQECVYVDQPTIIVDSENVHLAWVDNRDNPGSPDSPSDGPCEIYYKNSSDRGLHWSNDTRLTNASDDSLVPVIAYSNNNIHLVWQDKRSGSYEIFYKRKTNFPNITKPIIIHTPITNVYANETISIVATVTSNTTIKSAYLCYRNNIDVPYTIVNMTQTKGSYNFVGEIPPQQQNNTTIYYYIWVIDNNNHQNYTDVFNFTAKAENYPPTIDFWYPLENLTITENQSITFVINASDPNNDSLTYEWYLNNSLIQDEIFSCYTFTPDSNSSGNYSVKVVVSDGYYSTSHTWNIAVINIEQLQATLNNLQNQLKQMIENNTVLQTILEQLNENLTSLEYQLNLSIQNNTALQEQILSLNENITSLKNQINQLIQEKGNLEDERDEAIKEKGQAERNTVILGFLLIVALAVCTYSIVLKKK